MLNGASSVGTAAVNNIQVLCVRIKSLAFVAGVPPAYGAQDGVGIQAGFSRVSGMAVDTAGNLYVNDTNAVRKVTFEHAAMRRRGGPAEVMLRTLAGQLEDAAPFFHRALGGGHQRAGGSASPRRLLLLKLNLLGFKSSSHTSYCTANL